MATRIRLARGGKKHRPFYRIVVVDSRSPRDGKFIERIGSYDPLLTENKSSVDVERAHYWLNVGAQPSERVSKLLTLHGVEHKLVVTYSPAPATAEAAAGAKAAGEKPASKGGATAELTAEPTAEAKPEPQASGAEAGGEEPAS